MAEPQTTTTPDATGTTTPETAPATNDINVAAVVKEMTDGVDKANAMGGLASIMGRDAQQELRTGLASGYTQLLQSKDTPEESITFIKESIDTALEKGEITQVLHDTMTGIIDDAGTDGTKFANLLIANTDALKTELAQPGVTPQVADANDATTGTQDFMTRLASGNLDLETLFEGLDFKNNPMQAFMSLITMFVAVSQGKDPQEALAQAQRNREQRENPDANTADTAGNTTPAGDTNTADAGTPDESTADADATTNDVGGVNGSAVTYTVSTDADTPVEGNPDIVANAVQGQDGVAPNLLSGNFDNNANATGTMVDARVETVETPGVITVLPAIDEATATMPQIASGR